MRYTRLVLPIFLLFTAFVTPFIVKAELGCDDPKPDYVCQRQKLLNPGFDCALFYCPGNETPGNPDILTFNLFGIRLRLDSSKAISQVIYLAFMGFLGVVALVITGIGMITAVQRANADSEEAVKSANKRLQNAIAGLIMIVLSVAAVQIVAGLLGLGSIDQLADFSNLVPGR